MWQLPKEMYAEISRLLPNDYAGALMRKLAGDVIIKDIRYNRTYGNGLLHSFNDEPAATNRSGDCFWFKCGIRHRENGPAIIFSTGVTIWYLNNNYHCKDGPAILHPSGSQVWYKFGKLHREDGPAVIHRNGNTEWYINGIRYYL